MFYKHRSWTELWQLSNSEQISQIPWHVSKGTSYSFCIVICLTVSEHVNYFTQNKAKQSKAKQSKAKQNKTKHPYSLSTVGSWGNKTKWKQNTIIKLDNKICFIRNFLPPAMLAYGLKTKQNKTKQNCLSSVRLWGKKLHKTLQWI